MENQTSLAPTWLSHKYVENIMQLHFGEESLKVNGLNITKGSKEGDNYLGLILRLEIEYEISKAVQNISLIGKLTPDNKVINAIEDEYISPFEIEANFYTYFAKSHEQMAGKKIIAETFYIDYEKKFILMEDMTSQNFIVRSVSPYLDLEHALAIIKTLATFHGNNFRILQKSPNLKFKIGEPLMTSKPTDYILKLFKITHLAIEKTIHQVDIKEEWRQKLLGLEKRLENGFMEVCEHKKGCLNFVIHGDIWTKNMMFRYEDGVFEDHVLLDFQTLQYNSFAIDLHFFFFSSVDAQVVVQNLDTLLKVYFTELGQKAPGIPGLTFERIKKEFMERLFCGMICVVFFRSLLGNEVAGDLPRILSGEIDYDEGWKNKRFIADLKIFLKFFEDAGVF